jgi:hypothetical protein
MSFQARNHKVAYDYIVCPRSARGAIGIVTRTEETYPAASGAAPTTRFRPESARKSYSLAQDPFLCNHRYTRGVRFYSKDPSVESGLALAVRGRDASNAQAMENVRQLDRMLLVGAACNRGRVRVGAGSAGTTQRPTFTTRTPFGRSSTSSLPASLSKLCADSATSSFLPWLRGASTSNPYLPSNMAADAGASTSNPYLPSNMAADAGAADDYVNSAEVTSFIEENVPYWQDHDIYAIDPEGNPYLPSNMNMQYNWDLNYGAYSFNLYVQSWSPVGAAPLTLTLQNDVWGTLGANNTWSAFNYDLGL